MAIAERESIPRSMTVSASVQLGLVAASPADALAARASSGRGFSLTAAASVLFLVLGFPLAALATFALPLIRRPIFLLSFLKRSWPTCGLDGIFKKCFGLVQQGREAAS